VPPQTLKPGYGPGSHMSAPLPAERQVTKLGSRLFYLVFIP